MPRPKSALLTEGELRLMQVLWDRGRATVGDVVAALQGRRTPAYNTVLTMLRILETKGYVRHDKEGRAFVYEPPIDRQQARRSAVKRRSRSSSKGRAGQLVVTPQRRRSTARICSASRRWSRNEGIGVRTWRGF